MQLHNNIITHSAAGGLLSGLCVLLAPIKRKQSDMIYSLKICTAESKTKEVSTEKNELESGRILTRAIICTSFCIKLLI
jgi:hypothetical protein